MKDETKENIVALGFIATLVGFFGWFIHYSDKKILRLIDNLELHGSDSAFNIFKAFEYALQNDCGDDKLIHFTEWMESKLKEYQKTMLIILPHENKKVEYPPVMRVSAVTEFLPYTLNKHEKHPIMLKNETMRLHEGFEKLYKKYKKDKRWKREFKEYSNFFKNAIPMN